MEYSFIQGKRSLAIHGHFYQPPREDPLTGKIPDEPGAEPYRNWNQRILAECYRPNAELGNFSRISFNVGPTLCEWMESYDPATCEKIVAQDQANVKKFGVGNAIAQAYNHTILPLANLNDKVTQVSWGIADFKHRFGRKPQGMWLPETAVDMETLEVLAEQGIEFTILAPWQADSERLDPTQPYLVALPGGKSITVFFYHASLSAKVSFDPEATTNADVFIKNYVLPEYKKEAFERGEPQLLLIATDGELYGHHQHFRDRFLAHLVNGASEEVGLNSTYPALYMRDHPPRRTIGIKNKTSWSCHHGVTRWMGECDCTPNSGPWKTYFRRSMDKLAASLDQIYYDTIVQYIPDPWALRNRYIEVILCEISAEDLIWEMAGKKLDQETTHRIYLLLESQRERQRIFTSCGWFFEDFARIEPKNNITYAAMAVRLTKLATGEDLSSQALSDLRLVVSSRTGLHGDTVFKRQMSRLESLQSWQVPQPCKQAAQSELASKTTA